MRRFAYIGHVWPEPESSAAGVRTIGLIEAMKAGGWEVHFLSPEPDRGLSPLPGVQTLAVAPNDPEFDRQIARIAPDLVLFDRFHTEERFGWRVEKTCPEAARVLDTVDLHGLRSARRESGRMQVEFSDLGDEALRELASILRSDLALVISPVEETLLRDDWGVRPEQLFLSRVLNASQAPEPKQGDRSGFAWIGNFRHPPNLDSVRWLKRELWPRIRELLPSAEISVYGAYPPREVTEFDDAQTRFRVRGPARDSLEALSRHRVNLAPLRFGAGIKGKVVEGWRAGLPVVATPVAAEGLGEGSGEWGGIIAGSPDDFCRAAVRMHEDETLRLACAARGVELAHSLFDPEREARKLLSRFDTLVASLAETRARNLMGRMLRQQAYRSTEYFSRWIELKNSR